MIKKYTYGSRKVQMAILQDAQSKVDVFRPVAVFWSLVSDDIKSET